VIHYEKYRLSRLITVQELVSADYLQGVHLAAEEHVHKDAWELCVCMEGQLLVMKNRRCVLIDPGEIALIQPGTIHGIGSDRKETTAFIVSFTGGGEHLRSLQDSIVAASEEQLQLFSRMIEELKHSFVQDRDVLRLCHFDPSEDSPLGAEQMICSYLEQAIILLLRKVTMHQGEIVRTSRFKDAMQNYLAKQVSAYIDNHLSERLTVESIAENFHYSRSRLSTLFKAATGLGVGEVVTYRRICRAKILLLEQKKTIAQIAEEVGFTSPQYFSHKFMQEVGCSPSRYVAMVRGTAGE